MHLRSHSTLMLGTVAVVVVVVVVVVASHKHTHTVHVCTNQLMRPRETAVSKIHSFQNPQCCQCVPLVGGFLSSRKNFVWFFDVIKVIVAQNESQNSVVSPPSPSFSRLTITDGLFTDGHSRVSFSVSGGTHQTTTARKIFCAVFTSQSAARLPSTLLSSLA